MKYPIIRNCNYETSDRPCASIILSAVSDVERNKTKDTDLIAALDSLEETLTEHSESDLVHAIEACRDAEKDVVAAYSAMQRNVLETEIRTFAADEAQDVSHGIFDDAISLADGVEARKINIAEGRKQLAEMREKLEEASAEIE